MLLSYQSLDSTNLEALRWSECNQSEEDVWFIASEQTGGLGQRNRAWSSPFGGLYVSVLYTPPQSLSDFSHYGLITLVSGAAVYELVKELLQESSLDVSPLKIHWPNDVYFDSRKLSGILTQSAFHGKLITGIGINANASISVTGGISPVSLREILQKEVNLNTIFDRLREHWNDQMQRLVQSVESGQNDYASQTERKLAWLGESVTVTQTDESRQPTVFGVLTGLTPLGALKIKTADGERVLVSGSVRAPST